jgi:hypothetical protein
MSRLEDHAPSLRTVPIEYRPELRWWLAEGLHTDRTLRSEIEAAHRLGFGGMEFLAMDEGAIDHARYGWGSEEWVHDSAIVVEETTARGMSVSFTSGTNWSNANLPTIDPDHPAAAKELNFVTADARRGAGFSGPLPRIDLNAERDTGHLPGTRVAPKRQHLEAVVAAPIIGENTLDATSVVDLTDRVVGEELSWEPEDGRTWRLFVFWSHGTGQTADPSATTNYTVNYLDRDGVDAVIDYWSSTVLTPQLREQIARNPRAQMYMDSLELTIWGEGGLFWGHSVRDEFRRRRGYDIAPWLPFLVREVFMMAANTTCSASSTRPRPARPPATTCSTTASTTRSSTPSSPQASPRRCCTAGPALPARRTSRSGRATRACGPCSPSGSTCGSRRASSTRSGTTRSGATNTSCGRGGRASTSASCAPTTSSTTCPA